jgi:hypothetical protein
MALILDILSRDLLKLCQLSPQNCPLHEAIKPEIFEDAYHILNIDLGSALVALSQAPLQYEKR